MTESELNKLCLEILEQGVKCVDCGKEMPQGASPLCQECESIRKAKTKAAIDARLAAMRDPDSDFWKRQARFAEAAQAAGLGLDATKD